MTPLRLHYIYKFSAGVPIVANCYISLYNEIQRWFYSCHKSLECISNIV